MTELLGAGHFAVNWEDTPDEVAQFIQPHPSLSEAFGETMLALTGRGHTLADVMLPQLGETVTEGTITRWIKSVGDRVARDEPLFEVSTDKVDSEVPSPADGVLLEILVSEGETADVGTRLAVIGDSVAAAALAPVAGASAASSLPPSYAAAPPSPPPVNVAPPVGPPATTRGTADDSRLLSPVVRSLLREKGIATSEVVGTGIGGRITREDVLRLIDGLQQGAAPAVSAPPTAQSAPPPPPVAPAPAPALVPAVAAAPARVAPGITIEPKGGDRVIPFSDVHRQKAEDMVRSKATSLHAFIAYEVDFENVERVRKTNRNRFNQEEGFSLTYLPFIARAAVEVLRDFPNLNASIGDEAFIVHQQVNLGVAVYLDHEELIVPVIHHAEEVTLRGVARRIRDLADRARTRQLSAEEISGGTFSITNDGPFGSYFTVPIIDQPQVAILATDGIKRRPVVVEHDGSESIAIHSTGNLGISWDHRAVDGAYVSSFLARVAELIATRDWAAEL